jgi:hypothetical protein
LIYSYTETKPSKLKEPDSLISELRGQFTKFRVLARQGDKTRLDETLTKRELRSGRWEPRLELSKLSLEFHATVK